MTRLLSGAGAPDDALPPPATPAPAPSAGSAAWYTVAAAGLLLAFFLWLAHEMFALGSRIGDGQPQNIDQQWARALTIYASIEALAFAAAGVLLGTTVQAGRVGAAEERAARKDADAEQAKQAKAEAENDIVGLRQVIADTHAVLAGNAAPGGPDGAARRAAADDQAPPSGDAETRLAAALRLLDGAGR